ncbi:MAG: hypothetical protein JSV68_10085 [Anaerolineaceae bacterium]|nr:MAG: hypothetical protein JSV68_10085 [Anaerolineaceae bacterium]
MSQVKGATIEKRGAKRAVFAQQQVGLSRKELRETRQLPASQRRLLVEHFAYVYAELRALRLIDLRHHASEGLGHITIPEYRTFYFVSICA